MSQRESGRRSRVVQSKIRNPKSKIVGRLFSALAVLSMAVPCYAQISVTSVSPDSAWAVEPPLDGTVELTITGSFPFPALITVTLSKSGQPDIVGTGIWVDPVTITTTVSLVGAAPGKWGVEVTHSVLGSATLPGGVAVKSAPSLRRIGAWGGPVQAMEVVGNLGYVARGSGMVILDLTDPANMVELASLDLEAAPVFDIAVAGNYAYVCGRTSGVTIVDVSDSSNPSIVVTAPSPTTSSPAQIALQGNAAYVNWKSTPEGDWTGDMHMLDISDPQNPTIVGGQFDARLNIMTVSGNYLYMVVERLELPSLEQRQLEVYDVSGDPFAPVLVGSAPLFTHSRFDRVSGLAVDNGFAYVTLYDFPEGQMVIVNVADPTAPFLNGIFLDVTRPQDVVVANGIAYLADFEDGRWPWAPRTALGFAAIDVSDPVSPTLLSTLSTHSSAVYGVTVSGNTAYLFDRGEGVIAVDVTDPLNPTRLGNWHSPGFCPLVQDQEGDLLYLSDFWNGVTVLDVSDPRAPTLVGVHQATPSPTDGYTGNNGAVRVKDGFAYFAAGWDSLEVVDFTDPANPVLVGGYQVPPPDPVPPGGTPPRLDRVALKGSLLILGGDPGTGTGGGEWLFDITDPPNPLLTSFNPTCMPYHKWVITDDFLAIAGWVPPSLYPGVIRDVSDPFNPVTVAGGCFLQSIFVQSDDLVLEGDRIYSVFDRPQQQGHFFIHELQRTPQVDLVQLAEFNVGSAQGVAVENGIAYATGQAYQGPGSYDYYLGAVNAYDAVNLGSTSGPIAMGPPMLKLGGVHARYPYVYVAGSQNRAGDFEVGLSIFHSAVPGDGDGDFDTDLADYAAFQRCFGGDGVEPPEAICLVFDFDEDDDVDADDYSGFLLAFDPASVLWATSDPAEFTAFATAKGLTQTGFEDFEEMNLGPDSQALIGDTLDSATNNGVFSPGDIVEGLTIQTGDEDTMTSQLHAFTPSTHNATSKVVTADWGEDESPVRTIQYVFPEATAPQALAFDVIALTQGSLPPDPSVNITVFDTDDKLIRVFVVPGSPEGDFLGFWSARPIGRVRIRSRAGNHEGADNIQMWSTP